MALQIAFLVKRFVTCITNKWLVTNVKNFSVCIWLQVLSLFTFYFQQIFLVSLLWNVYGWRVVMMVTIFLQHKIQDERIIIFYFTITCIHYVMSSENKKEDIRSKKNEEIRSNSKRLHTSKCHDSNLSLIHI